MTKDTTMIDVDVYNLLSQIADDEIKRSTAKHGNFNSRHEAYAVILEEWEEAKDDIETVDDAIKCFWHCVKNDIAMTGEDTTILRKALSAAAELIQVAAMARKYIQTPVFAEHKEKRREIVEREK